MTNSKVPVNNAVAGSIAPLKNVAIFTELTERVVRRDPNLPGFGIFSGWSGLGKTRSAIYAANKYQASYVEVGESWTKRKFVDALMQSIGLPLRPATIDNVLDQTN